jgi:hypothetical protein
MKTILIIILTSLAVVIAVAVLNFASYEDKLVKPENKKSKV